MKGKKRQKRYLLTYLPRYSGSRHNATRGTVPNVGRKSSTSIRDDAHVGTQELKGI